MTPRDAQHCYLHGTFPQAAACCACGDRRVLLHCSPLCIIHHAATGSCLLPVCPQQLTVTQVGRTLRVGGWVKTGRTAGGGDFAFLELNDGSTFANLQVRGVTSAAMCTSCSYEYQRFCTFGHSRPSIPASSPGQKMTTFAQQTQRGPLFQQQGGQFSPFQVRRCW